MVHEAYDALFFSTYLSFPLEGKCHVVAKGCTGLSSDVILYRYPDRQSAASLANSWPSPPSKLGHTYGVKVLRIDRPDGRRVLKFDGLSGRGLRIAALRQCL